MDTDTYLLIMQAASAMKNLSKAIKLYYLLRQKPVNKLDAHEKVHIENMEIYAQWQSIDL